MRFADILVGQFFKIEIGGCKVIAEKTKIDEMKIKKVNNPGFVYFYIDPELNQDDVALVQEGW